MSSSSNLGPGSRGPSPSFGAPGNRQVPGRAQKPNEGAVNANDKSKLQVNPRQERNPVLSYIKNVPFEISDAFASDFNTGNTCVAYLDLSFHRLHPEYIKSRISEIGGLFRVRILLLHVNEGKAQTQTTDVRMVLEELNKLCFVNNFTLMLAFSAREAARYLEVIKHSENRAPTSIQEKDVSSALSEREAHQPRAIKFLTSVRSINKSNVNTLLDVFSTVRNVVVADEAALLTCPGMGAKKAKRLFAAFKEPFRKNIFREPDK